MSLPAYNKEKTNYRRLKYFTEYSDKIDKGEITVSKNIQLQIDRIKEMCEKHYVEYELGQRPILFIERFCHNTKGSKDLLKLHLSQKVWIEVAYSLYTHNSQGKYQRLIREVLIQVSRGSGKSTICSALALYNLIADHENGSEVYALASTREQANILFEASLAMSRVSPWLDERLHKSTGSKIKYDNTNSVFEIKTPDYNVLDGLNGHAVFFDEVHSYRDDGRIIKVVNDGGFRKRNNPMTWYITTNGTTRDCAYDKLYARGLRNLKEKESDRMLAFLYELDSVEEIHDEEMWQKAIPLLDTEMLSRDVIREDIVAAKSDPTIQAELLSKVFGIAVNGSQSYFTNDECELNPLDTSNLRSKNLIQQPVIIGLDLSEVNDFCSISILKPFDENQYDVIFKRYLPKVGADKVSVNKKLKYDVWKKDGWLKIHDDDFNNQTAIFEDLKQYLDEHNLTPILLGYDNWNARVFVDLFKTWYSSCKCERIPQNVKTLSPPMKEVKALMIKRKIYFDDPVFRWCLSNVVAKIDAAQNVYPRKETTENKIDDFLALLNAYTIYNDNRVDFEFYFLSGDTQANIYNSLDF